MPSYPLRVRIIRRAKRAFSSAVDRAYDRRLNIDTLIAHDSPERALIETVARGNEGTGYLALRQIAARSRLSPDEVIFDVGCGFGRVICYLARRPVARCVGIELREDLASVARVNSERLRGRRSEIEVRTGDAMRQDYSSATAIYLYNPFDAATMKSVLAKIEVDRQGRPTRFIYVNPAAREAFDRALWLRPTGSFRVPYLGGLMEVATWVSKAQAPA